MKRFNGIALSVAFCSLASQAALAQTKIDTLKVQNLNEVIVKGVRATKEAPYAVANIRKPELKQFSCSGQELPFLLSRTPGILAWSENGIGTGTTYMRIRGAAGSRINVTLDGVALNSPEDQTVFWANMNSYSSLLGSIQVQRGVGSSTNGDGAFGGSISMATAAPSLNPTAEVTGSFGSYNTYHTGASFSTGLLGKHLIFDGAYHETATDGYVDGTAGRSGSYYGGLTWLGDNFKISYKNIGNFEKTGQAWNGVLGGDYNSNFTLLDDGIRTYKDMYKAGLDKFNVLTGDLVRNGKGDYTITPYTLRDGSKWDKTTDNFYQNHNILSASNMQFQLQFITDELPQTPVHINQRTAVRGVIHYQNKILMVQTNRGDYKFPGGGMEEGETEKETLLREITEETGYTDIHIGVKIGETFEQNIDTEDPESYFQMKSCYYECWLMSDKRAPGVQDDYEEKLGFHGTFVTVEEAYQSNLSLLKREQKKMHDFLQKAYIAQMDQKIKEQVTFAPEIPWLERETQVLCKLNRTLVEKIADAVRECGKIMLDAVRTADMVETKEGHANFVTVYDKKVQETLRKKLLEILPEAVFVGEEDDVHASIKKGFAFIVDPIDGTTNFIKDYHVSAISAGLAKDGEKYIGVVYNPYLDEMFTAERGKGAFLNGRPIHVSRNPLSEGIVLFGTAPYYEELSKKSFQMAYAYFKKALDVRRSGSAAIDLCSIAAGRAELFFELRLSPWDFAAGALIVEEAGGVVTTVEGGAVTLGQKCSVLATNGRCGRLE